MRGLWTAAAGLLTLNAIGASPLLKPTRHHMLSEKAILYSPLLVKKETLYAGIFYTVQNFDLRIDREKKSEKCTLSSWMTQQFNFITNPKS